MEVNTERIFQRLEALEGQIREHAVLIREVTRRLERQDALSQELGCLDAITSEVQRRVERLERIPDDISEMKQDLREIRSRIEAQGHGTSLAQSLIWSIIMLILGYLLNTLPRLLGI